ncbi:cytochrome b [Komagataeibacter rhaeticus]|uniref:Cytochrome b n=1 Tax=Komagataeibacter rhaeticus TaxID=215221 RepID=A0A181CD72_9PROT|nr:cytochrome b/b6 domain-containing protein [Komagataeibacter rhaeticus]ATU71745.1 cytochrome b [Komagataeibacter xylinus]KDU95072.1 cytochrome B561 [Komagataeibacter rhaeticus AF1]MBL7239200.1 cytochrome b [Komagataeibacter rhaeticus]PYD53787.1 cytochrome b [Komagataeibacter rhaeticus]QIP36178.1 cytochrome b [Komagataeibacter rhaeticus]
MTVSSFRSPAPPVRYSWETRWLHWLTAVLVVEQFTVGQVAWHLLDRGLPLRAFLVVTHTSLGVLLAAVFVTRIAWGMTGGRAIRFPVVTFQERIARSVHRLLYLLLGGEIVFGYMARWSTGRPVIAFGIPISSPFPVLIRGTHSFFSWLHHWNAWLLLVVAAFHAGAGLYHLFVYRDRVFQRMLP